MKVAKRWWGGLSRPWKLATLTVPIVLLAAVFAVAQTGPTTGVNQNIYILNSAPVVGPVYHIGDTIQYEDQVENTNLDPGAVTWYYFANTDPSGNVTQFLTGGATTVTPAWSGSGPYPTTQYFADYVIPNPLPAGLAPVPNLGYALLDSMLATGTVPQSIGGEIVINQVTASTQIQAVVIVPAITITKTVDFDANGTYTDSESNYAGSTASWKIQVTNTGTCRLYSVVVTDTHDPTWSWNIGELAAGATTVTTYPWVENDDRTDTAYVTGADVLGGPKGTVSANDSAQVTITPYTPCIDITKTVDFNGGGFGDCETYYAGEQATWKLEVRNCGNVALHSVVVTDTHNPSWTWNIGNLAVGETTSTTYVWTENADRTDTAYASGIGPAPLNTKVTASDDACVEVLTPCIDITKTVDFNADGVFNNCEEGSANTTATWRIEVRNCGDATLTSVVVTDTHDPAWSWNIGTLSPGQVVSTTYDTKPAAPFTNWAYVRGVEQLYGRVVTAQDDACVTIRQEGGASRTVGFWQTHLCYTNHVFTEHLDSTMLIQWLVNAPDHTFEITHTADVMGFLWDSPSYLDQPLPSSTYKRKGLAQAKVILARQMVAAILNTGMPGGLSGSFVPTTTGDFAGMTVDQLIAAAQKALALTSASDRPYIIGLSSMLDYYNNYGDDVEIAELTEATDGVTSDCIRDASSQEAKALANFRYPNKWHIGDEFLWMNYTNPTR